MATRGFFIESQASLNKGIDVSKLRESDNEGPFPFVFVYTGQGAQWAGMGKELLAHSEVFKQTIKYLDSCLREIEQDVRPIWTLEALLRGPEDFDISAANISQPVCTAVQIALTDLLKDWGALPEIVVGHSSGEIGAAYAAGAIDARQAILASYFRGVAVTEDSTGGSMAAVGLGKDLVQAIIDDCALGESVTVACANSPDSTTVSGDTVAVDDLLKTLQEREIWNRKVKTGGKAYHSHHMKIVGSKYEALLECYWNATNGHFETSGDADNAASSVEMISTVTGEQINRDQVAVPRYWRTNLESPVRFDEAIQHILLDGSYHLVELGPHSALQLPIKQNASALEGTRYNYTLSLMRHHDAWLTTLQLVGSLFLHRHDELRYSKIVNDSDRPQPHVLVDLPPYPWDYSKPLLWSEPRMSIESRHRKYPRHDLLGSQMLGGGTAGMRWRNVLSLHESKLLTDHRLGPSVVFPAAGYISMAVEAMCQVSNLQLEDCPGVELRELNFAKALDMDLDRRPTVEIFSEMSPMRITNLKISDNWWRFTVVSVDGDAQATMHMNAAVRLAETPARITRGIKLERSDMQQDAARVWYERFTQEGLAYGPRFAVMEEIFRDRARAAPIAAATTHLQRGEEFCRYITHPATIDAMLQTALVATASGIVSKMRATVPVAMDSVYIAAPSALDMDTEKPWGIDGDAEKVGFGTFKCNAEIFNSSGQVLVRLSKIRCIAYQGNIPTQRTEQRDPIVRDAWRPDLSALTSPGLESYLSLFVQSCESETVSEDVLRLAGVLDLACHQRSNINILELGNQTQIAEGLRETLRVDSSFRRYNTYCRGVFANGDLVGADVFSGTPDEQIPEDSTGIPQERKFDIILVPSIDLWTPALAGRLTPDATVVIMGDAQTEDSTWTKVIKASGSSPITAALINSRGDKEKRRSTLGNCDLQIQKVLQDHWGSVVGIVSLSQVSLATVPDRSFVVSTLEQQLPLLNTIDYFEMGQTKLITDRAAKIVWLTNGGLMDGGKPDFGPILGLSRSLMLEQPSLQFAFLDVDDNSIFSHDTSQNIVNILERLIHEPKPDFEFAQRDGVLHISRWEPDERLNKSFRLKRNEETIELPLENAGRCQLSMKSPGQLDTIHFVQEDYSTTLDPDYVEISVKSIGINAKDLYALNAKIDIMDACCSLECAGVITALGDNISEFKTGDLVVAMAGTHFATVERLPHWAVAKLNDDEDFVTSSTIPTVFSTAIYALKTLARLQPGETVMIHSAAGGVGIAAIQFAKHLGAKIFATVGTEYKKSFLVEKFDMNPDHIFSSRNSSFLPAIMEATSGQGVDVVLNSLTGDLLRSSFEACASFGRFIEIGERDIMDHGALDMFTFGKLITNFGNP
ncbi:Acyl transferase/acyl hydrolase/lysophospholipase [Penicillium malachiteum]|nr:Acyl transferase/acyl hydrolase/lysophospholipase [Penicillium malachiteum]